MFKDLNSIHVVAIILARGGSKGIPNKNIINFCGKPLMAWTIEHCLHAGVKEVYVSSDSEEILNIAQDHGAASIKRPEDISGDTATSESGWLHAIEVIGSNKIEWVIAPQVTSPLRTPEDIKRGLALAGSGQYDSIFSCSVAEDLLFWQITPEGILKSINYDYQNRGRRQDRPKQYIENGSFYLFRPEILRKYNNRLGGRIGMVEMEFWKMFEIDTMEDLKICEVLMREFLLKKEN